MRIERTRADPTRRPATAAADVRQRPTRTGGTARRSTAATRSSPARSATRRGRQAADRRPTACCRATSTTELDLDRRRRQLLGRAGAAAHALHARAQRDLRPAAARVPGAGPTRSCSSKARLINAALMAKIHTVEWTPAIIAHPTTQFAHARELVGPRSASGSATVRPAHGERGGQRHPRLADRPPRRAVLADRGVRRRLPHAPADPGRLHLPLARDRRRVLQERDVPRPRRRRTCGTCSTRSRCATLLYSFGHRPPRRDRRCTTIPRFLQEFERPDGDRPSTSPRSTSCASASSAYRATTSSAGCFHLKPARDVRGADRQPAVGGGAAAGLRRRSSGRPDGRPARRAEADGLRLQRHGVPRSSS